MGRAASTTPRRTVGQVVRAWRAAHAAARTAGGRAADAGMATAEYAIATLAAVGFAGVLVVVLKSNEVKSLLTGLVRQALGG